LSDFVSENGRLNGNNRSFSISCCAAQKQCPPNPSGTDFTSFQRLGPLVNRAAIGGTSQTPEKLLKLLPPMQN
jgi:hypothetical protein